MTLLFNKKSQTIKRKLLRHRMPQTEKLLWVHLKNKKLGGYKFRRQFSIYRYVVDFYCPELRLAIEVDGTYHNTRDTKNYDDQRSLYIKSLGIAILRFTNTNIEHDMDNVLKVIREHCSPPYEARLDSTSSARQVGVRGG